MYHESYLFKYARVRPNQILDFDFKDYLEKRNLELNNDKNKKVLMLTNRSDYDSAILGINLIRQGVDYIRVDVEDIPINVRYLFKVNSSGANYSFILNSLKVDLDNIGVVWLRDFNILNSQFSSNRFEQKFLTEQWMDAMLSLQRKLKCTWINSAETNRLCDDKFEQLIVARSVGFMIPNTIVTNDPRLVREEMPFTKEVIVKVLHHHDIRVDNKIYTVRNQKLAGGDFSSTPSFLYPFSKGSILLSVSLD